MGNTAHSSYKTVSARIDKYLLVGLVFLLPFERIPSVDAFGVTLRLSFFAAGLVIVRALYILAKSRKDLPKLGRTRALLIAFMGWVAISGFSAINYPRALQVVIFTGFTITTALAVAVLYKDEYLEDIVKSLLLSATLVALFGIYQYIGDLAGLPNWATGLRDRYSWQVFGFPRIQSVALEPLYYCSYLLIPSSIVAARLLLAEKNNWLNRGLLLLFATSIFLTVSRGGIAALVGMLVFMSGYGILSKKTRLKGLLSIIAITAVSFMLSLLITTYFAKPPVNRAITGGKKGTAAYTKQLQTTGLEAGGDERAQTRKQALAILKEDKMRFVLGIGPGQFGPYVQGPAGKSGGWFIVNNEPIEMLLEFGLIGVGLFLAFGVSLIIASIKFISAAKKPSQPTVISLALVGYLFATAIQYQTFSTLYIMHIWVVIGLLMAIALGRGESTSS